MLFDLRKPCAGFPFIKYNNLRISKRMKRKYVNDIIKRDKVFVCHRTTNAYLGKKGEENHCAGALIIMEKNKIHNRVIRIATAIGGYNSDLLKMDSPVFDNFEDFVETYNV